MGLSAPALAEDRVANGAAKIEYSGSLLAGYGAGNQFQDDPRNHYGLALGGRAGLMLAKPALYFGLSFLHYTGEKESSQEVHSNVLDAEVGYEFPLLRDRLFIRPQIALGVLQAATIQPDNAGYPLAFHWAPGVLVGARVGPLLVSAEYRYDLVASDWPSSNTLLFGLGLRL